MQNLWYLVAAYGVIWAVLLFYAFSIARRQQRLSEELTLLESELKPADAEQVGREEVRVAV